MSEETKRDDGGPAFPVVLDKDNAEAERVHPVLSEGLKLRDWFAGQALAGYSALEAVFENVSSKDVAEVCYEQADAMLAERRKG